MYKTYGLFLFDQRVGNGLKGLFQVSISKDIPIYVGFMQMMVEPGASNVAVGRPLISAKMLFLSHPPLVAEPAAPRPAKAGDLRGWAFVGRPWGIRLTP
jgi:hypothetical protein